MKNDAGIEIESLTKRFGSVTAIDDLDLVVRSGEVFGLLGPNGAGKSTMIDLVLGLKTPTEGRVSVFGTDVTSNPRTVRRRTGVLPENYDVYDGLTGREHLRAILRLKGVDGNADQFRDLVGLRPEAFARPAGEYSKGMRQRLALALALAGDPDLLILDEPSSGLDPDGIALVREIIRDRAADSTTVFFSSHRLSEVETICDRVGIIDDGRLLSVEDVDTLTDRTGGSERLRLYTGEPPDDGLLDQLRSLDAADGVQVDGRTLVVDCTTPEVKGDVIELVNRASSVRDFELEETALEEVFDATIDSNRAGSQPSAAASGATGGGSE